MAGQPALRDVAPSVTITDNTTQASLPVSYGVDIVTALGGDVRYAGFTGNTGTQTTNADVQNWSYQFTENPSARPRMGETMAAV
jgi:hypothetical protein